MHDNMTLEDVIDLTTSRRERQARQAQILAWFKFALVSCAFAALAVMS